MTVIHPVGGMETITLREAALQDLSVLLSFEQQVIEAERTFNESLKANGVRYYDLEDLIANEDSYLAVAETSAGLIGSGYAQIRASKQSRIHEFHAYLGFMYVVPEFRGMGINRMMIDALMQWSRDKGVSYCYLDVYCSNEAAIQAYEKAGFTQSMTEMKLILD